MQHDFDSIAPIGDGYWAAANVPGNMHDFKVWYVVIADCSLEQIYHEIPPIKYDVTLLNGKHHIPAEQHGLATTYSTLTIMLCLAGIGGHFLIREQRQALGELHLIVKLLLLAYMLNLVACLFECIHLWLYGLAGATIIHLAQTSCKVIKFLFAWPLTMCQLHLGGQSLAAVYNEKPSLIFLMSTSHAGTGSNVLHIMSELSASMFGSVVNFVLLALACGWTLTDSEDGRLPQSHAFRMNDGKARPTFIQRAGRL